MITDYEIEQAKKECRLSIEPHHEHDDCIRMAYQWLDAQTKTKHPNTRKTRPIKHLIEKWCGRYVSQADVEIAAYLHPGIIGRYPWFNISSVLTEPTIERLKGFGEAFRHEYRKCHQPNIYQRHEVAGRATKTKKETDFRGRDADNEYCFKTDRKTGKINPDCAKRFTCIPFRQSGGNNGTENC